MREKDRGSEGGSDARQGNETMKAIKTGHFDEARASLLIRESFLDAPSLSLAGLGPCTSQVDFQGSGRFARIIHEGRLTCRATAMPLLRTLGLHVRVGCYSNETPHRYLAITGPTTGFQCLSLISVA
eukprot:323042-Pelagomonas_calceolata.AAC.1